MDHWQRSTDPHTDERLIFDGDRRDIICLEKIRDDVSFKICRGDVDNDGVRDVHVEPSCK
jgi:hypothetical protein